MKELKLAKMLNKLIEQKGASVRDVSRVTGIPQSTLNGLLGGASSNKPEQVLALAQYFGTSMEFLLFGEDERPPTLGEVLTEGIFEGWLKVRIERAIPDKRKGEDND